MIEYNINQVTNGIGVTGINNSGVWAATTSCPTVNTTTSYPAVDTSVATNVTSLSPGAYDIIVRPKGKQVKKKAKQKEVKKKPEFMKAIPVVHHVAYCDKSGEECVVVVFDDGTKVIKKPVAGDTFDLNVGVALAIAERIYGTKTQFHKMIKSCSIDSQKRKKNKE